MDLELSRATRVYPKCEIKKHDSVSFNQINGKPPTRSSIHEIKFHSISSNFINAPDLEELYQKKFAKETAPKSLRICCVFLVLYLLFTGPNFANLFSSDPAIVAASKQYCLMVYLVMFPIPILLWVSTFEKCERFFQPIYTVVILCWSFSFLAGGMHSMISEWYTYVQDEIVRLLDFIQLKNDPSITYVLDRSLENCNCNWWFHMRVKGTPHVVLFEYLGSILLPAATMNINLLRLVMVFVVVPLLKLDTLHYGVIVTLLSFSYCLLTSIYYPSTQSPHFHTNKILVFCFPIIFSVVMLLRTRDFERILRQDFLHMWSVERAAEIANRQKELFAEENKNLKQELAKRKDEEDAPIDLESPIQKILTDLKSFQEDTNLSAAGQLTLNGILSSLSRLDINLFTPDIKAQMKARNKVDKDTKDWAIAVLGQSKYKRAQLTMGSRVDTNGAIGILDSKSSNSSTEILPLAKVISVDDDILNSIVEEINMFGWDLDTISIAKKTNDRPLFYVTLALIKIHSVFDICKVDVTVFKNFLFLIDDGYITNPYHNSTHAADVVNSVVYLMSTLANGQIRDYLTNHEFFASIVAAVIHDFRHPGKSNNYMIKTQDPLAVQYSDRSVLENMHLAETFFIILGNENQCNIFGRMKEKHYLEIRKAIIEMVLSTDLSMHLHLVGNLKAAMLSEKKDMDMIREDPMMMMKVVIKCADIGHAAKSRKLHGTWSSLIIDEFFLQGDEERAKGLDISPFMDRSSENSAKNQVGFFEFIVLPFYETVSKVIFTEDFEPISQAAKINYLLWKEAVKMELTSIDTIRRKIFNNNHLQISNQ